MSTQKIKLYPLITYNQTAQSFNIHHNAPISKDPLMIVSVIEMKKKDYALIGLQNVLEQSLKIESQEHGLYISQQVYSQNHNANLTYLVLPYNQYKIGQKYQDLLASFSLALSNVCIFDIGSKYLRQTRTQQTENRYNYVTMNTTSNGTQLYKAVLTSQGQNNKLQISNKICSDVLVDQLVLKVSQPHKLQNIIQAVQKTINRQVLLKNYLIFQELQIRFGFLIKMKTNVEKNSKQYNQLIYQDKMLTRKQFTNLQECLLKSINYQLSSCDKQIYNKQMNQFKKQLREKNESLTLKNLLQIKRQYFWQISSLGQLYIKQDLAKKLLQQYGISADYVPILSNQSYKRLQYDQIQRLKTSLCDRQGRIDSLSAALRQSQQNVQKNIQQIKIYQQKCMNFRQLYTKFNQKCNELQRQRIGTMKNKTQISNLLAEQQRRHTIQKQQLNKINQLNLQKQHQQAVIASLQNQLREKQTCIIQLTNKNNDYQDKIRNYQSLEGQAWKSIQDLHISRQQLNRYKNLVQSLQGHFESFKKTQINKFNYILKRNNQIHIKTKKQLQQKTTIIQDNNVLINKLRNQLQEERKRLKYCQDQTWLKIKTYGQQKDSNFNNENTKIYDKVFNNMTITAS